MNASDIISKGIEIMQNGFHAIDPFKSYKEEFVHYSDIKEQDDFRWKRNYNQEFKEYFFDYSYTLRIPITSECGGARIYSFFNSLTYGAYSGIQNRVNFINPTKSQNSMISIIHETGHSFCSLFDEYKYNQSIRNSWLFGIFRRNGDKNCVRNPKVFGVYGSHDYGGGCFMFEKFYRPSENSIMRKNWEYLGAKFNVISCGYCLKEIKGGSMNSNWNECMNMGTIKPI